MTTLRLPAGTPGTVTGGALLWNGTSWVNSLAGPSNIASGYSLVLSGTGSPENVVTGPVGTLYGRTDGGANTTLYVKESGSGNTGWVAK